MWAWSLAGSRRTETPSATFLHVEADIHAFFLTSRALGFRMDLCENPKALIVDCIGTVAPLGICYQEVFL